MSNNLFTRIHDTFNQSTRHQKRILDMEREGVRHRPVHFGDHFGIRRCLVRLMAYLEEGSKGGYCSKQQILVKKC